jgi:2-polyprenyl-3-methyl-5-hydroxy-6-metoxy-1,4-benzoquinol methylase
MTETGPHLPTAMVTPPCPACGRAGDDAHPVERARPHLFRGATSFGVSRCSGCGTLFTSPRLSDASLGTWYDALQALPRPPAAAPAPNRASASALLRYWRRSEQTSPVAAWIRDGPVLDLGCGQGQLLAELRARGLEADGVEWDGAAVEAARRQGLRVTQADLGVYEPPAAGYRHIVLSHVLEHLPEPAQQLRRVARGLTAEGSLLVAVPNAGSALRYLFGRHWVGWDVPFHLTHFTPGSMRAVAARAGLRVVRARTPGNAEELRRSLNNALRKDHRMLALRVGFFPVAKLLALAGVGSALLAELERVDG